MNTKDTPLSKEQLKELKRLNAKLSHELDLILTEYDKNELIIKMQRFDRLKSLIKKSNEI